MSETKERIKKPDWLKIKLPTGNNFTELNKNISDKLEKVIVGKQ